jgi:hypothetical protein
MTAEGDRQGRRLPKEVTFKLDLEAWIGAYQIQKRGGHLAKAQMCKRTMHFQ